MNRVKKDSLASVVFAKAFWSSRPEPSAHDQCSLLLNFAGWRKITAPLTSAPAEKNLPSPVRTVKTVSGCSFSSLIAAMVSTMSFPPKAFRDFGRLNYDSISNCNELFLK